MIATVKERPLNCKDWEVKAILDGRKMQFRRVVKHRKRESFGHFTSAHRGRATQTGLHSFRDDGVWVFKGGGDEFHLKCPYGSTREKLWVRETWGRDVDNQAFGCVCYKVDGMCRHYLCDNGGEGDPVGLGEITSRSEWDHDPRWKSPIHMPRWASRLTLEVTGVRVERVQDISEGDASAAGVVQFEYAPDGDCWTARPDVFRSAFEYQWNEDYGWNPNAWSLNPWVWVVDFKRTGEW